MVAEATASSTFEGFATVADLWASLPQWPTPNQLFGADRPRCLTLEQIQMPDDNRPIRQRILRPTHAAPRLTKLDVDQVPTIYPTMAGIRQDGTRTRLLLPDEPLYTFFRDNGTRRPLYEIGDRAPGSDLFGDLIVRPRVGDATIGPPSVFLTLWALLFCLSELARYYPDTWVGALDPDTSRAAVTLEHGLDLALEQTPSLIGGALRGPLLTLALQDLARQEAEAAVPIEEGPTEDAPSAET